jgi:hypothetical protein
MSVAVRPDTQTVTFFPMVTCAGADTEAAEATAASAENSATSEITSGADRRFMAAPPVVVR